jgi:DUF1680 family protein
MHRHGAFYCSLLVVFFSVTKADAQQNAGDQFLDGIGETALIARYLFDGDTEDWSRNKHRAVLQGSGASFTFDPQFGKVLSLPGGNNGAYVALASNLLEGVESLSVTGWIKLDHPAAWQRFFDLGQDTDRYFFCTPMGAERPTGCRVRITQAGHANEQGPCAVRAPVAKWLHLAAVLDTAEKTLSLHVDGVRVGETKRIDARLDQIINQTDGTLNRFSLGKSQFERDLRLGGHLHDVRFYRIALSDAQVAAIYHNANSTADWPATTDVAGQTSPSPERQTRLLVSGLKSVPKVTVRTPVGQLPRLPRYVPGLYQDGVPGPLVRVIWPAPTDNGDVVHIGQYTVRGSIPGSSLLAEASVEVLPASAEDPAPAANVEAFSLGQVALDVDEDGRETPFMRNRNKFLKGLSVTDPDSFLYNFRDAFGQQQPDGVRPLGGWDSQTSRLRGHASGHYLTALAQAYASTAHDRQLQAKLAEKMNTMVDVLHELARKSGRPRTPGGPCNADPATVPTDAKKDGYDSDLSREGIRNDYWNWGEGYISGYPPDQFIMLERGATYGSGNHQIWAPYYTLHKLLAGLMDCYEIGGNNKALRTAEGMGLWVYKRLKVVPEATRIQMWDRYIAGEFGGMNAALARLHRLSGDRRFLECAQFFDNINLFFGDASHAHGLAKNVDTVRGKHANQHVPQIIGSLETYGETQDVAYYRVAENFWDICVHGYMYSIGGVAGARNPNNAECFTCQPDSLYRNGFSPAGQNETCATYNLLKLSRRLFMFDQNAKYIDYYEQALYNHILASVAADSPANTYHVPLNPGSRKSFGNPRMNGFTCCNGTAMESHTKLQDSIYFKSVNGDALYVNLFIPSSLNWPARHVTISQRTQFPYADTTMLVIGRIDQGVAGDNSAAVEDHFDIHIRVPKWIADPVMVKINGEKQSLQAQPGTYLTLRRRWQEGDRIEVKLPMTFRLSPLMDRPNIASIFYGPILLAVEEPDARSSWRQVTLSADDIGGSFNGDPNTLRFRIGQARLKPFYETYGRHSVYVDVKLE